MAFKNFRGARNIAVLALVLLCAFALPQGVRNFAEKTFREFRAPVDVLPSRISDLQKYWSMRSTSKQALMEAARDLARVNAAYELKVVENDSLRSQIVRLENILQLPSEEKFKMEVARVVARDVNAWWQRITLRKGSIHGIREGYAVIYGGGVVGRVDSVGLYTCEVELVSSRNFRIACHFRGDDRPVIYQGQGGVALKASDGEVRDVPKDISLPKNGTLSIVTSSLAGSFPDGIEIGKVASLSPDADEIFKSGTVVLNPELSSIREVSILVPVLDIK